MAISKALIFKRRRLLKWTTPLIAIALLPKHVRASGHHPLNFSISHSSCSMTGGRTFIGYELTNKDSADIIVTKVTASIAGKSYDALGGPSVTIGPGKIFGIGFEDETTNLSISCVSDTTILIELTGHRLSHGDVTFQISTKT